MRQQYIAQCAAMGQPTREQRLEAENGHLKLRLLELKRENAQLKARLVESERAAYDVAGTIAQLKEELAQATQREARLRACLRTGLGPFANDPGGYETWYVEATLLVQEAGT